MLIVRFFTCNFLYNTLTHGAVVLILFASSALYTLVRACCKLPSTQRMEYQPGLSPPDWPESMSVREICATHIGRVQLTVGSGILVGWASAVQEK